MMMKMKMTGAMMMPGMRMMMVTVMMMRWRRRRRMTRMMMMTMLMMMTVRMVMTRMMMKDDAGPYTRKAQPGIPASMETPGTLQPWPLMILLPPGHSSGSDQRTSGSADQRTSRSADQQISGSADQRTSGSADQRTRGSADQRTSSGSADQQIRGSADQRTSGSADQRIRGPADQGISGPADQRISRCGPPDHAHWIKISVPVFRDGFAKCHHFARQRPDTDTCVLRSWQVPCRRLATCLVTSYRVQSQALMRHASASSSHSPGGLTLWDLLSYLTLSAVVHCRSCGQRSSHPRRSLAWHFVTAGNPQVLVLRRATIWASMWCDHCMLTCPGIVTCASSSHLRVRSWEICYYLTLSIVMRVRPEVIASSSRPLEGGQCTSAAAAAQGCNVERSAITCASVYSIFDAIAAGLLFIKGLQWQITNSFARNKIS